jgi:hypothetical protein
VGGGLVGWFGGVVWCGGLVVWCGGLVWWCGLVVRCSGSVWWFVVVVWCGGLVQWFGVVVWLVFSLAFVTPIFDCKNFVKSFLERCSLFSTPINCLPH